MPSGAEASLFGLAGTARAANCALAEEMDKQDLPAARYVTRPPAPTVGDPLHYDAFIQALCALHAERFGSA